MSFWAAWQMARAGPRRVFEDPNHSAQRLDVLEWLHAEGDITHRNVSPES
jgi:hypothetical protein